MPDRSKPFGKRGCKTGRNRRNWQRRPRSCARASDTEERQERQVQELVDHTQRLIARAERRATSFWKTLKLAIEC